MADIELQKLQKEYPDNKRIQRILAFLDRAVVSSNRLDRLIGSLLDITKFDGNQLKPRPSSFNFSDVVKQQVQEIEKIAKVGKINIKGIETNFNVNTDNTFLCQIVNNLIMNACRYSTPNTDINIKLDQDGDSVFFEIQNEGPGIPRAEVSKIFDPFFQSSATDKGVGGSGLGLTLSMKYAQSIGGSLELLDPSPKSTIFKLSFPKLYKDLSPSS